MTRSAVRGPTDATQVPRYAGPATFARLPRTDEVSSVDVAVLGVPFDSGVSYRPGARFGPGHIRACSKLLRPYNPALAVEPFGQHQVADAGDVAVNPFDLHEAITQIQAASDDVRSDGAKLLTIGGDHTIALPLLRSLARDHGKIAVLHFDAHLDTWDTYFGAPYTHGTPFRRASEEGLLDLERCLHMGTRGPLYSGQDLEDDTYSASRSSVPTTTRATVSPRLSTGCAPDWATRRSMSPSTSTSSTPPTPRAPAPRKPVA